MTELDEISNSIVRAAYQISGLTGTPVSYDQLNAAVPLSEEDLRHVIRALRARGLVPQSAGDQSIELTPEGIAYAAALPPVSEPPIFQDI
jgi:hypothetical protein